jgi:hypothetical protein
MSHDKVIALITTPNHSYAAAILFNNRLPKPASQ